MACVRNTNFLHFQHSGEEKDQSFLLPLITNTSVNTQEQEAAQLPGFILLSETIKIGVFLNMCLKKKPCLINILSEITARERMGTEKWDGVVVSSLAFILCIDFQLSSSSGVQASLRTFSRLFLSTDGKWRNPTSSAAKGKVSPGMVFIWHCFLSSSA